MFSGVSFSPDGRTLIYCSNQPPILSPAHAYDRLVQLQESRETQIVSLDEQRRKGRDANRQAVQDLVSEMQTPGEFRLYTIDVESGHLQPVAGTTTAWPAVTVWHGHAAR